MQGNNKSSTHTGLDIVAILVLIFLAIVAIFALGIVVPFLAILSPMLFIFSLLAVFYLAFYPLKNSRYKLYFSISAIVSLPLFIFNMKFLEPNLDKLLTQVLLTQILSFIFSIFAIIFFKRKQSLKRQKFFMVLASITFLLTIVLIALDIHYDLNYLLVLGLALLLSFIVAIILRIYFNKHGKQMAKDLSTLTAIKSISLMVLVLILLIPSYKQSQEQSTSLHGFKDNTAVEDLTDSEIPKLEDISTKANDKLYIYDNSKVLNQAEKSSFESLAQKIIKDKQAYLKLNIGLYIDSYSTNKDEFNQLIDQAFYTFKTDSKASKENYFFISYNPNIEVMNLRAVGDFFQNETSSNFINDALNVATSAYEQAEQDALYSALDSTLKYLEKTIDSSNLIKTSKSSFKVNLETTSTTPEETSKESTKASTTATNTKSTNTQAKQVPKGYRLLSVAGGDLSGYREPNAMVDVGYGPREYWAYTNAYGQLVKITAKEIILQDDATEAVNEDGRYYDDEAKVSGTELAGYDEGHVIADSLGGVSNAYNITPQNSALNRYGDQAYMEKVIRQAGGAYNFTAEISYPNTYTQIPSSYKFTYTLKGQDTVIVDQFTNEDPEEYNQRHGVDGQGGSNLPAKTKTNVPVKTKATAAPKKSKSSKEDISWIDTNHNGRVTIAEAKAAGFKMPIYKSHWLYKYMYDADGDGMVGEGQ